MQIAALTHASLHWRQDGDPDGRTIVFANSLGTDLRLWDKVVDLLPEDFRVIRFDKRGHGLSSCPDGPYSMADLISDTEALLDRLSVKDTIFVGLSIGGMIAQGLAVKRPDLIKTLILSNTAAKMGDADLWNQRVELVRAGKMEALADPIMERWFTEPFRRQDECILWRNMLTRTPKEGYAGCCCAIAETDFSSELARIKQPTLGICGDQDGASPPDVMAQTINKIAGAQFGVISNAGHLPCVEQPVAFTDRLIRFVKEVDHV